jgi:hypothetical protein
VLTGCIDISLETFSCVALSDFHSLLIVAFKVGNIPEDYYQCQPNYHSAALSRICAAQFHILDEFSSSCDRIPCDYDAHSSCRGDLPSSTDISRSFLRFPRCCHPWWRSCWGFRCNRNLQSRPVVETQHNGKWAQRKGLNNGRRAVVAVPALDLLCLLILSAQYHYHCLGPHCWNDNRKLYFWPCRCSRPTASRCSRQET